MKSLFVAVIISALLPVSAQALDVKRLLTESSPYDPQCKIDSSDARKVMQKRQAGVLYKHLVVEANTLTQLGMIGDAYNYPVVIKSRKQMQASLFGKKYLNMCQDKNKR